MGSPAKPMEGQTARSPEDIIRAQHNAHRNIISKVDHPSPIPAPSPVATPALPQMDPPPAYAQTEEERRISSSTDSEPRAPIKKVHHGENNACCSIASSDGFMNIRSTDGCMNIESTDGCMNIRSTDGCMNIDSHGGCMNIRSDDGCMNINRGSKGGCCQYEDEDGRGFSCNVM